MAERKKLTMYYPSDFDPKLVPKIKRDPNFTCEVRMMLPFNVQCNKCGEFMYMGKKFNSRQEKAEGEKYKGIQILRFYIKCGTCSNMMTFKTDPERSDYSMESGGTRTFEMWQEANAIAADNQEDRRVKENEDAMTTLENRTRETQKMVDMLDQLDELKAMSQRNQRIDADALMRAADEKRKEGEEHNPESKEDEELVKSIKFASSSVTRNKVLLDDSDSQESDQDSDKVELKKKTDLDPLSSLVKQKLESEAMNKTQTIPKVVKKARKLKPTDKTENENKKAKKEVDVKVKKLEKKEDKEERPSSGLGLGDYGSSEESD